jgi:DNA replication and repair protein RecF
MIDSIRLQNFRSYGDESFEFDQAVNIVVGPNASGKTNLLEAIIVAARGGSYRVRDSELVRFNSSWARLDVRSGRDSRSVKLENQSGGFKKTFDINGQILQRLSLQKSLPAVLFEPNHLLMFTGPPELRRSFLDDLIEQITPGFASVRRAYRRSLSQRNSLLKQGIASAKPQIFAWDLRLSELGGKIVAERLKLIGEFGKRATNIYRELSNTKANIVTEYVSVCLPEQYETSLLRRLEASLDRDCLLGFTGAGPHRDDIRLILNGKPAEISASRGETRSLVLVFKLLELELLEAFHGSTPLLLLDDVFSELDGARRHALTSHLRPYQTFITTTDADIVGKNFTKSSNILALI